MLKQSPAAVEVANVIFYRMKLHPSAGKGVTTA
jgi:hypothetical protein